MPNDTIQARMETIRELFLRLYPTDDDGNEREDRQWPAVCLSYCIPEDWDSDCSGTTLKDAAPTDGSTGAWKAGAEASVAEEINEDGWVYFVSRGPSPEIALDGVLSQLKAIAKPLFDAIARADAATHG